MADTALDSRSVFLAKEQLRQQSQYQLHALPRSLREQYDATIVRLLLNFLATEEHHASFSSAEFRLAAYAAFQCEPVLNDVLTRWLHLGRALFLPRYTKTAHSYEMVAVHDLENDLISGHYGILEPRAELRPAPRDLLARPSCIWLIPGLAFDSKGHRLGRGAGYYDRLLEGVNGVKVGVAYNCQVVNELPSDAHDIGVDYVVTETGIRFVGLATRPWDGAKG